jgi:hypothetical protein
MLSIAKNAPPFIERQLLLGQNQKRPGTCMAGPFFILLR